MSKHKPSSIYTQATVTETVQKMRIINNEDQVDAGLVGLLHLNGKPVLAVRGGESIGAASQVYIYVANLRDEHGEPVFKFSKKARGLVHKSATWGTWDRVTGAEMLAYLDRHFVPCQLVTNASTGRALGLLDATPIQFGGVIMQTRFSGIFAELFSWID
jgi:hypothetical protein